MSVLRFILLIVLVSIAVTHFTRSLSPSAAFEKDKAERARWTGANWAGEAVADLLRAGFLGYAIYLLWP